MPMSVVDSRPWLALFRTDFVALLGDEACGAVSKLSKTERNKSGGPDDSNVADEANVEECDQSQLRRIVLELPLEIVYNIFGRLDAEGLSSAAQTCIQWRAYAYDPRLWRILALRMWPSEPLASLEKRLWTPNPVREYRTNKYREPYLTWRRLVIYRPHLRTNGIYVQRHQYAKSRRAMINSDGSAAPPVVLVTYFRLMRFYNDGTLVSLVSPEPPDRSYRRLRLDWQPSQTESNKAHPSVGNYSLIESTETVNIELPTALDKLYPSMLTGVQHLTMSLSGTHPGAYNRLYLRDHMAIMQNSEIVSYRSDTASNTWRFVPLYGFRTKVYEHFSKEAHSDGSLANWVSQLAPLSSRDTPTAR